MTRLISAVLLLTLSSLAQSPPQTPPAAAPEPDFKDLPALLASLPAATVKPLDAPGALFFSALPLTCVDDLQTRPGTTNKPYFWQPTYRTIDAYDRNRAFYGCTDWTTAVTATWTLVTLVKKYPELGSAEIVREKLTDHLGRQNLDGELAYFRGAANAQRPYGWIWYLRLYAELATWKDADGARYAENAAPLARLFADGLVGYLVDLERPTRAAGQTNSAFTLNLLLDYVDVTRDMTIKRGAADAARRLFQTDTNCATNTEAASPEMISPCLEEAVLMSRVLDQTAFVAWFDKFLPAANTTAFKPLRSISFDLVGGRGRGGRGANAAANSPAAASQAANAGPGRSAAPPAAGAPESAPAPGAGRGGPQTNPRTNWIALAFTRAQAYSRLASALPAADPRVPVFRRLADIHAENGQKEVVTPAAFDAPWVGALAVSYLTLSGGAR